MKTALMRFLSLFLVLAGILLVANAGIPILGYEIFSAPRFKKPELISPVAKPSILAAKDPYPLDLTKASNWFVDEYRGLDVVYSGIQYYNLAIPKLGIKSATAKISGDDLAKSLIHYRGTALPGQRGNAVIFGHSILPQFFNPENYLSIFSTLPTLKKGDEVSISYDGINYTYRVEEMYEVGPQDIQVLEQRYDDSYVTLITCVPPGTYLRRLVVKGRLVPSQ